MSEIREVRERLAGEVADLEDRLPQPAVLARKAAGVAVGGGLGGTILWMLVRRSRSKRAARRAKTVVRETLPNVSIQPVVQVLPERWAEPLERAVKDGRAQQAATIAAAMYVLMKGAELRRLRKLTNALTARG